MKRVRTAINSNFGRKLNAVEPTLSYILGLFVLVLCIFRISPELLYILVFFFPRHFRAVWPDPVNPADEGPRNGQV